MITTDDHNNPEDTRPVLENTSAHDQNGWSTSPSMEQIPDWLLEMVSAPILPELTPSNEDNQLEPLPEMVLSFPERLINFNAEPKAFEQVPTPTNGSRSRSIWVEEDAVELGPTNPDQAFADPLDELKILLDEDPQQTALFIRAHMSDPKFREQAMLNLRAYLTLDPRNNALWMVYDELQLAYPQQED